MKDRRKRNPPLPPWKTFFSFILALVFLSGFTFSTLHLFFKEEYHPKLVTSWRTSAVEAISGVSSSSPVISVRETVVFPDQAVIFLSYHRSIPFITKGNIDCVFFYPNSSGPQRKASPLSIDGEILRCPLPPRGMLLSVSLKAHGDLPPGPTHDWDMLAYEAVIDRDNTTVVFVKGLNLRPGRASNASRFECVYGWDFTKTKFLLRSDVVSIAQEIVRCRTPLSVLNGPQRTVRVSIRVIGGRILQSIARPKRMVPPDPHVGKHHRMCVCTMLRNQARFLREWIIYHSQTGVGRWFLYDNNSNDDIENVIERLVNGGLEITRHTWPWIKTQEAGFAHCALQARESCEWVGFIDVDEFIHLPSGITLNEILSNYSSNSPQIVELRTSCHSFGPSGLKEVPSKGVTVGYTCRVAPPERHKSIVRVDELNPTLINMVHHFALKDGFRYVNMDRNMMVINHYKYQVWDVFKEKFYRRVATYVSDWEQDKNVGSKDRAPGLGTRAVEPPDWSTRFCEVTDTGLRDRVLATFMDPKTGKLPWEEQEESFLDKKTEKQSALLW